MSQQNTSARVLAFGIFTGFGILFAVGTVILILLNAQFGCCQTLCEHINVCSDKTEQVNHINTPSWNDTGETSEKTRQGN